MNGGGKVYHREPGPPTHRREPGAVRARCCSAMAVWIRRTDAPRSGASKCASGSDLYMPPQQHVSWHLPQPRDTKRASHRHPLPSHIKQHVSCGAGRARRGWAYRMVERMEVRRAWRAPGKPRTRGTEPACCGRQNDVSTPVWCKLGTLTGSWKNDVWEPPAKRSAEGSLRRVSRGQASVHRSRATRMRVGGTPRGTPAIARHEHHMFAVDLYTTWRANGRRVGGIARTYAVVLRR